MRSLIFSIILAIGLMVQSGCKQPEPIRIGFLGGLTARSAGLGTSGRDGFLLAIEEANDNGGIGNHKVEGLVQDAGTTSEAALNALNTLVGNGVQVIVGPMTSQTAVTVVPAANQAQVAMISPTASTNQLSGIDDYFFRVYYTNAQAAKLLAGRLLSQPAPRRIAAIYDLGNRAYTEDWVRHFQEELERGGGSLVARIPFEMRSDTLFLDLASNAAVANPQGILILANAVDTAMICQQLAKIGSSLPRFATGWSYSDDLIQFGGRSVEDLIIIQSADLLDSSPSMQRFVKAYQERFRSPPNFPALHAYDATRMALAALAKTTDRRQIRQELLKMKSFSVLQTDLSFDSYGELKSPHLYLARISNGRFVKAD